MLVLARDWRAKGKPWFVSVQEMQRRSSSGGSSDQQDPSVSWAIDRFWQRRPLLASRSINTLRSKPLGMLNSDGESL